jgi:hypothetical protein
MFIVQQGLEEHVLRDEIPLVEPPLDMQACGSGDVVSAIGAILAWTVVRKPRSSTALQAAS